MKANELRIGNLVFDEQSNEVEVSAIWANRYTVDQYQPIPITEDYLLRFGFYKLWHLSAFEYSLHIDYLNLDIEARNGYRGDDNRFRLNLSVSGEEFADDPQSINNVWLTRIQFVHQLQNLYFSLTGQELVLK